MSGMDNDDRNPDRPDLSRRRLLSRLGMAAGAAYAAPVLLQLGTTARADSYSRPSRSRPSFSGRRGDWRDGRHDGRRRRRRGSFSGGGFSR